MQPSPSAETAGPGGPSLPVFMRRGSSWSRKRSRPHDNPSMAALNWPNFLTVVRILLVPVLVVALLGHAHNGDIFAAIVFALASVTDFVDGYLARSRDSVTTFGKVMDSRADKLR